MADCCSPFRRYRCSGAVTASSTATTGLYFRGELRRRLRAAGFRVEDVRYFFLWTVVPLLSAAFSPAAGMGEYDVADSLRRLNAALRLFSRIEHAIGRIVRFPVGSSLLAVA